MLQRSAQGPDRLDSSCPIISGLQRNHCLLQRYPGPRGAAGQLLLCHREVSLGTGTPRGHLASGGGHPDRLPTWHQAEWTTESGWARQEGQGGPPSDTRPSGLERGLGSGLWRGGVPLSPSLTDLRATVSSVRLSGANLHPPPGWRMPSLSNRQPSGVWHYTWRFSFLCQSSPPILYSLSC